MVIAWAFTLPIVVWMLPEMLERAINVDSTNGLNYYYLSEAWLYKGNFKAAEEFNGLAQIYLKDSPQWMVRVRAQEDRIDALSR